MKGFADAVAAHVYRLGCNVVQGSGDHDEYLIFQAHRCGRHCTIISAADWWQARDRMVGVEFLHVPGTSTATLPVAGCRSVAVMPSATRSAL